MRDDTASVGCFTYVPSWRVRFWRSLGFHVHLGEEPPNTEPLAGWMQNNSQFHFDWADRLRLLLTGRLMVTTAFDFDTPSPTVIRTRMDWSIIPPGEV